MKNRNTRYDARRRPARALVSPMAFAGLLAACGSDSRERTGAAEPAEPAQPGQTADAPADGGADEPGGSNAPAPLGGLYLPLGDPEPATLHRLTRSELVHSLQDLLGADVPIGELEPDVLVGGFSSIGASSVAVSPAGVGLHEQAVLAATGYFFEDAARASARLPCLPADAADSECTSRIVTQFGRRAFRRPLTDDEIQRFTGLAATIGSSPGAGALLGIRYTLAAILQSPSFLYRVELGAPSAADGGRLEVHGLRDGVAARGQRSGTRCPTTRCSMPRRPAR